MFYSISKQAMGSEKYHFPNSYTHSSSIEIEV